MSAVKTGALIGIQLSIQTITFDLSFHIYCLTFLVHNQTPTSYCESAGWRFSCFDFLSIQIKLLTFILQTASSQCQRLFQHAFAGVDWIVSHSMSNSTTDLFDGYFKGLPSAEVIKWFAAMYQWTTNGRPVVAFWQQQLGSVRTPVYQYSELRCLSIQQPVGKVQGFCFSAQNIQHIWANVRPLHVK